MVAVLILVLVITATLIAYPWLADPAALLLVGVVLTARSHHRPRRL